MGNFLSKVAQASFAFTLLLNMLWSALLCKVLLLLPLDRRTRGKYAIAVVQLAWKISLFFAPWMKCQANTEFSSACQEFAAQIKNSDKSRAEGADFHPTFLLGNHTSFLDTILTVSKLPASVAVRARTYMGAHLFNLPLLSTVCVACGHFPVYFTGSKLGDFGVDRNKMAEVEKLVDTHIDGGGHLCFFPEGQMNNNPDKFCPFRYGGMKKALQKDAKLWSFVTCGNPSMWPRKAQVGGLPGRCIYGLKSLAPDGCVALVAELRKTNRKFKDKEDYVILAEHCHEVMQGEYDKMKATMEAKKSR
mmetsp:Transcript_10620/g.20141  ORF Transcript_10620/g.20141 Transcript_10620/m.20141 type:complete len:304 (+) Transcript_10620:48-959(+)